MYRCERMKKLKCTRDARPVACVMRCGFAEMKKRAQRSVNIDIMCADFDADGLSIQLVIYLHTSANCNNESALICINR